MCDGACINIVCFTQGIVTIIIIYRNYWGEYVNHVRWQNDEYSARKERVIIHIYPLRCSTGYNIMICTMWACHLGATRVPTAHDFNTTSFQLESSPRTERWETDLSPARMFRPTCTGRALCVRTCVRACPRIRAPVHARVSGTYNSWLS